jgi:hypothetical protein
VVKQQDLLEDALRKDAKCKLHVYSKQDAG